MHHQCTGIEACGSTAGSTSAGPLATLVTAGQQCHGLREVFLHLVPHPVVLGIAIRVAFLLVGRLQALQRQILVVVQDDGRILIVTRQIVVTQCTCEQGLSLETLPLVAEFTLLLLLGTAGNHKVTDIDHIVPVAPNPQGTDFVGDGLVEVVYGQIPYLRGIPYLVTTHHVVSIAHTGISTLHAGVVITGNHCFLQVFGRIAEIL